MTKTENEGKASDVEILPCVMCGEPCAWGACEKQACAVAFADALYLEEAHASPDGYHDYENELTGYEEHVRDSEGYGDARRCPRHPHVKTSSDDGMFDGDCGECEHESEMAEHEEDARQDAIRYPGGRCENARWMFAPLCLTKAEADAKAADDEIPF